MIKREMINYLLFGGDFREFHPESSRKMARMWNGIRKEAISCAYEGLREISCDAEAFGTVEYLNYMQIARIYVLKALFSGVADGCKARFNGGG